MTPRQPCVVAVYTCPDYRLPMQAVRQALAIANYGLDGCAHARRNSGRQVLLMALEDIEALGIQPGDVKENITTSGLDLMSLRYGQRLRVGQAVLEITVDCEPCDRMDEIRPGLLSEIRGRRGMMAYVVEGGTIRPGDAITVVARHRPLPLEDEDSETAVYPV